MLSGVENSCISEASSTRTYSLTLLVVDFLIHYCRCIRPVPHMLFRVAHLILCKFVISVVPDEH